MNALTRLLAITALSILMRPLLAVEQTTDKEPFFAPNSIDLIISSKQVSVVLITNIVDKSDHDPSHVLHMYDCTFDVRLLITIKGTAKSPIPVHLHHGEVGDINQNSWERVCLKAPPENSMYFLCEEATEAGLLPCFFIPVDEKEEKDVIEAITDLMLLGKAGNDATSIAHLLVTFNKTDNPCEKRLLAGAIIANTGVGSRVDIDKVLVFSMGETQPMDLRRLATKLAIDRASTISDMSAQLLAVYSNPQNDPELRLSSLQALQAHLHQITAQQMRQDILAAARNSDLATLMKTKNVLYKRMYNGGEYNITVAGSSFDKDLELCRSHIITGLTKQQ